MTEQNKSGRRVRIYISGPMRGHPDQNRGMFADASARYRARGAVVFNPHDTFGGEHDVPFSVFLAIDLAVVEQCDALILLPGWEGSEGASAEFQHASKLGLMMFLDEPGKEHSIIRSIISATPMLPQERDTFEQLSPLEPAPGAYDLPAMATLNEAKRVANASAPDVGTPAGLPTIKDSGQRQEFSTGSVRDLSVGKGRWDLLPYRALKRLALIYEAGARKYGDHNWERGQPFSRVISSGLHHLLRWKDGMTDEDHLAMAAWNLIALLEYDERVCDGHLPTDLVDIPRVRAAMLEAGVISVD